MSNEDPETVVAIDKQVVGIKLPTIECTSFERSEKCRDILMGTAACCFKSFIS